MSVDREQTNRWMLRTTDLDVTDVCLAVGYTSLGTFGGLFTAVVGQPLCLACSLG